MRGDEPKVIQPGTILSLEDSLDFVIGNEALTPAARLLTENIIRYGRVFAIKTESGEVMVLDVKQFLNHRVDISLMMIIGEEIANAVRDLQPEFVLTAPSSGISPAFAVAIHLGNIPLIYTQRTAPITFNDAPILTTASYSYTTGKAEPMTASGNCIPADQRGVAIDDFLDTGRKSQNLIAITQQAGSSLVGFGYAIEKSKYGGRNQVLSAGVFRVHPVLDIENMQPGRIQIKGIPHWLSLRKNGLTQ